MYSLFTSLTDWQELIEQSLKKYFSQNIQLRNVKERDFSAH